MPVLETLGGALFGAVLQLLLEKLDSHHVLDYFRGRNLNEKLLKELKRKLVSINAVVDDAEQKQFSNSYVKENDVVKKCPVCHGYCNCKACLSSDKLIKKMRESAETDADENVELSMYMLRVLLPYLRQLDKEQMIENEIEANIQVQFDDGIEHHVDNDRHI